MASVTIDGKEYDLDNVSQKAKENITSLQFVQAEINRLNSQLAVYKTAAAAYSSVIKEELDPS